MIAWKEEGDIITVEGKEYEILEKVNIKDCEKVCDFAHNFKCIVIDCKSTQRSDCRDVYFKEKV